MAKARALDKRRNSIKSIRKITRTMELISTARFKRAMQRASAGGAFTERIKRLVSDLSHAGLETQHPLLEDRPETQSATLLVLAANRGLAGGYNSAIMRLAFASLKELQETIPQVQLEVSGKRGISGFKFRRIPMTQQYSHFEERPSFEQVDELAQRYLKDYLDKKLDRLDIIYTRFETASRQVAVVETLLPLTAMEEEDDKVAYERPQYEFLPSAESILEEVLPLSFRVRLFKAFLDAAVSEQISRMVAMKAATENADTMISNLSMSYNRARQGQITGELLEIIAGAEAINN